MAVLKSLVNSIPLDFVSINDRGLNYGDGLFETICIANKNIVLWEAHYSRLKQGCESLDILVPTEKELMSDMTQLMSEIDDDKLYVLKIIVTRGNSERGYKVSVKDNPNIVMLLLLYPDYSSDYWISGVSVTICETILSHQPKLVGLKHLNRLEQVLARKEWNNEYQEGIMTDITGNVVEGVMSNIFLVKDNDVFTPSLKKAGVCGVMRQSVLNLCIEKNISIKEKPITLDELKTADEIFLTNSLIGLWPVRNINNNNYNVGKVTKNIMQLLISKHAVPYGSSLL